ncbi:MAG TPA: phage tail protein [Phycisphaerae bacterium]|nr:phage tail protein [Phycisphaerae bacterium]
MTALGNLNLDVRVDEAQLKRIERLLAGIPRGLPRAVTRGVNQTAVTGRKTAIDEVYKDLALKKGDIRAAMPLKRATFRRWTATVSVRGRRLRLLMFGARQIRRGVSYRVRRQGRRQTIRSAFIATMRTGHRGVFRRLGKKRLPIIELRGPSIPYVFETAPGILARTMAVAGRLLPRNIDKHVRLLLEKGR